MVLSGGGDWWCDTVPTIFWETNDDEGDPDSPLSFVLGLLDLTVFLQARFGFPFRIFAEILPKLICAVCSKRSTTAATGTKPP